MKRLTAIFFFVIYAATSLGIVVKFHFCDRALTHISLSTLSGKRECSCPSFMSKDCCADKAICLKIDSRTTTQQPQTLVTKIKQADLVPPTDLLVINTSTPVYKPTISFSRQERILSQAIYLLNRVFRI